MSVIKIMRLNFILSKQSQDAILTLATEKSLSIEEAIASSITEENYRNILKDLSICIALDCWGHFDSSRKLSKMKMPIVDIKITKEQKSYIKKLRKVYESQDEMNDEDPQVYSDEQLISYFILIELSNLGYHL